MEINAAYQSTLNGTEQVTTESLLRILNRAKKNLRPGVGSRSTVLFANPKNIDKVNAIIKKCQDAPDIAPVYPFRVRPCRALPASVKTKTGNIIYKNNQFVNYSSGPAKGSRLSEKEYLEMCLYFGWAEEETIEQAVWYEVDENRFQKFMSGVFSMMGQKVSDKINDEIAREVFKQEEDVLGIKNRMRYGGILNATITG